MPEVVELQLQHEDDRRVVLEAKVGETRVTQLVIKKSCVLGNHSHPFDESFHVVEGSAKLVMQYVGDYAFPAKGKRSEQAVQAPAIIEIPRDVAHAFVFDGPGILIARAQGEFKKEDLLEYPLA